MTGPAPKHPSRRARANQPAPGVTRLPVAGRSGKAPAWPLSADLSLFAEKRVADAMVCEAEEALDRETDGRKRRTLTKALEKAMVQAEKLGAIIEASADAELGLWSSLWGTPQATEWERTHAHRAVAMFVRFQIRAENGNIEAAKEARMWSDRLGLNPLALHKLKQEVERSDAAETQGDARRSSSPAAPAKKRAAKKAAADPRAGLYAVS
ncbi:hypothetical protein [Phycicoccus sp. 3266]|uniref:hypothetical protein n=1 Tax=Phycicoccus sp. 3266 TaxID=2817751 RepID=UPI002856B6F3|nr:hypothetical protein [Phycicoccus sp. 3266]MDR6861962.1 hypothetical protein [Phycicoccus sp. 3266]